MSFFFHFDEIDINNKIDCFVCREEFTHDNITFNTNGTVSAIPKHPLKYIPELSKGREEDLLILPNIALLVSILCILV